MDRRERFAYACAVATRLRAVAATALLVGVAASALLASDSQARPHLSVGTVFTESFDGLGENGCYYPGAYMDIQGTGFRPHERLRFDNHRVRADRTGAIDLVYRVPRPKTGLREREILRVRSAPRRHRHSKVRATLRLWSVESDIDVPPWQQNPPHPGKPLQVVTFHVERWFMTGVPLYVHYLQEFPFRPVPAGDYQVDFSTTAHYQRGYGGGYLHVVVGEADAVP